MSHYDSEYFDPAALNAQIEQLNKEVRMLSNTLEAVLTAVDLGGYRIELTDDDPQPHFSTEQLAAWHLSRVTERKRLEARELERNRGLAEAAIRKLNEALAALPATIRAEYISTIAQPKV